jgi:uncharacterized membrane protein YeaQ/YmgE (transglycosylase-associated protein family)
MDIITFLIVGLIAGWLASLLVKGQDSGMLGDIFIGVVGSFVGGFVFRLFDVKTFGFYGSIVMSVTGAVVFLMITRFFFKNNHLRNQNH